MKPSRRFPIRQVTALALLAALAVVCLMAGQWQLRRGAEREALNAAMQAGRATTPIVLSADMQDGPDWHSARVRGSWLHSFTVLLDNRNLKGQPGLWVATPLRLRDDPGRAVLVLRGWIPRPLPSDPLPDLAPPRGEVEVHGTLLHRVPRLFDLGSLTGRAEAPPTFPATGGGPPRVQNLALSDLAGATGLALLPVVLEQAPVEGSTLRQEWPGPSLDADQNYGYALQWFSFAAIALVAALVLAWRTWVRPRRPHSDHEDHTTS
ncbi:SURF1 family protein [Castellaniella sp. GW247-6E4]|uniref:SURF1 family protein n=1 Tax=Castellaniella sp. GW247-6E4 TaxID=3140380 RepID=UPI003315F5ED